MGKVDIIKIFQSFSEVSGIHQTNIKGGVSFLDVKMSFWTNVVESVCVCRMITKVGALESLHPEDTFSYL